jgi:hypothetical protein
MMSNEEQRKFFFSNGIDHRIVAIHKATEELNSAFERFVSTVSRLDSKVLVVFDPKDQKFKAETTFKLSQPSSDSLDEIDCIKEYNDKYGVVISNRFTTDCCEKNVLGVITQELDERNQKVTVMSNNGYSKAKTSFGKDTFKFDDISKIGSETVNFCIQKEFQDSEVNQIEDNLVFIQDMINFTNYITKKDKSARKGKEKSSTENLLENFHVTLETWFDLSKDNDLKKEEKDLFYHTMEGLRLFYAARSIEGVSVAVDLDHFLSHDSPQNLRELKLKDLVNLSDLRNLNRDSWKILKPLFSQYLVKQTGSAFADLLRSFWKPSKMERLKAEAVSAFETKPQNKGNLGGSKQKNGRRNGQKEVKQKAKDKVKKASSKRNKPAKGQSKGKGSKKITQSKAQN